MLNLRSRKKWISYLSIVTIFFGTLFSFSHFARAVGDPPFISSGYTYDAVSNGMSYSRGALYGVNLTPHGIKHIYVMPTLNDSDGTSDIDHASVIFHRSGVGTDCTEDPHNCYHETCSFSSSPSFHAVCDVPMQYYADATGEGTSFPTEYWQADMTVTDLGANTIQETLFQTLDVNPLLAVQIPSTLNFGTLHVGESTNSGTNTGMQMYQYGNTIANLQVSGTNMTCSSFGSIPVGNIKWSLADVGSDDVTVTPLSETPTTANLALSTIGAFGGDESGFLFWNLVMPTVAGGTCSGTITVNAIAPA